jgi:hypothetical protein
LSPRAPLSPALLESRRALALSCEAATTAGQLHVASKTTAFPSAAAMARMTRDIFRRQALEFLADSFMLENA